MIVETKQDGKSLRTENVPACEIDFPPIRRSIAAADKVKELMSKETITLDEALKRPEVEQAARDADITQEPVQDAPETGEVPALFRRYLLSIANQRRESFDDLSDDEIYDMLLHPRFTSLKVLPFDAWSKNLKG